VALDFVGPLPEDGGFNSILTVTDRLGSDVRIIPTRTDATAEDVALLFFDQWYCENGLPLELISDRGSVFVSAFWRALHKLTGVKVKMSTAYHPETDGASERTNKTINQCLRFHVERTQKGWLRALPRIRFQIMNTVNASTGFTGFQLRHSQSLCMLPPLVPREDVPSTVEVSAADIVSKVAADVAQARDNLLLAKVSQAFHASVAGRAEDIFVVGDKVMLSTFHRRKEYKKKGDLRAAKFFPRQDGPYVITDAHAATSNYTLALAMNVGHPWVLTRQPIPIHTFYPYPRHGLGIFVGLGLGTPMGTDGFVGT
jgi:hypothetical protein